MPTSRSIDLWLLILHSGGSLRSNSLLVIIQYLLVYIVLLCNNKRREPNPRDDVIHLVSPQQIPRLISILWKIQVPHVWNFRLVAACVCAESNQNDWRSVTGLFSRIDIGRRRRRSYCAKITTLGCSTVLSYPVDENTHIHPPCVWCFSISIQQNPAVSHARKLAGGCDGAHTHTLLTDWQLTTPSQSRTIPRRPVALCALVEGKWRDFPCFFFAQCAMWCVISEIC